MSKIINQIYKIQNRIERIDRCEYLYEWFDELVGLFDSDEYSALSQEERACLRELVMTYARESTHNNYGSDNWVRYSARCFYCTDYLGKYLGEGDVVGNTSYLNSYFVRLVNSGVAAIIPEETLDKYIQFNVSTHDAKMVYGTLLTKAISESLRGRTWSSSEMELCYKYTTSINRLIRKYVKEYSDYSLLREWLPHLNISHFANIWERYPDSGYGRHYSYDYVEEYLNKMLDIHLGLFSMWYWHDPQEMIDTLSVETLITILDVAHDDEFEKMLRHAATLPKNDKIIAVLEHFTQDDEGDVAWLAERLLRDVKYR